MRFSRSLTLVATAAAAAVQVEAIVIPGSVQSSTTRRGCGRPPSSSTVPAYSQMMSPNSSVPTSSSSFVSYATETVTSSSAISIISSSTVMATSPDATSTTSESASETLEPTTPSTTSTSEVTTTVSSTESTADSTTTDTTTTDATTTEATTTEATTTEATTTEATATETTTTEATTTEVTTTEATATETTTTEATTTDDTTTVSATQSIADPPATSEPTVPTADSTTTTTTTAAAETTSTSSTTAPACSATNTVDGDFEGAASAWTLGNLAYIQSNVNNAYQTPYGSYFAVLYGQRLSTASMSQTIYDVNPSSLSYSFRIYGSFSLPTASCTLTTAYAGTTIQSTEYTYTSIRTANTGWQTVTVPVVSGPTSGSLSFSWYCNLYSTTTPSLTLDNVFFTSDCGSQ